MPKVTQPTRAIDPDMDRFLAALPKRLQTALANESLDGLIEVVLDLGRLPYAVLLDREMPLGDKEVTPAELQTVAKGLGKFGGDNRAGIERTLHRFSAIRNRENTIIGLTCRVGRSVQGTSEIIRDLIESGQSILMLGRPGVGKTTILRETARILSSDVGKRVLIVDTSNEIGGDGDIPHPAIGRARRLQVSHPDRQHQVMIEAVENHMPEVIVIDEMGTTLEAEAARTIAERGVQLIATAHGNTLENLMINPTLNDLVGGIQSVTLGDDEARRRRTQKTILERKAPPTFDILIELHGRDHLHIHPDLKRSVDLLLRNQSAETEVRERTTNGEVKITKPTPEAATAGQPLPSLTDFSEPAAVKVYFLGLTRRYLLSAAKHLGMVVEFVDKPAEADMILALKRFYKKRANAIRNAESDGIPLLIVRQDSQGAIQTALLSLVGVDLSQEEMALQDAREAVEQLQNGAPEIELPAQGAALRKLQHEFLDSQGIPNSSKGYRNRRRVVAFAMVE